MGSASDFNEESGTAADDHSCPPYVEGHGLLKGKSVLITAAAGVGIGFATAKKAIEEGCRAILVSDVHERRLAEAAAKLAEIAPGTPVFQQLCHRRGAGTGAGRGGRG